MGDKPQGGPPESDGAPGIPGEPAVTAPAAEPQQRTPHDVIVALQAEAAELKDRLLRAHAEVENIRKRAEREKEDIAKYAVTKLARDIVSVGDNFQRAIDAVPAGAAEQDAALKSFLEGVTMTERELLNALERHGIKRVQPINETFNPHLHQAVMEVPRSDVPTGTIVQVFQAGFLIEDRVLRPAMVAVAKGGPKPPSDGSMGPAQAPVANENSPPG
ncbi:MAG TPA: nucleotide exchange factor GrpE [Hyphomicrobiaceae bacterium]|jgi:molecular chaperone GrpE|nr:nucleotide exchange factor GrpE [Hyphomicrobiaceae bacterium]